MPGILGPFFGGDCQMVPGLFSPAKNKRVFLCFNTTVRYNILFLITAIIFLLSFITSVEK